MAVGVTTSGSNFFSGSFSLSSDDAGRCGSVAGVDDRAGVVAPGGTGATRRAAARLGTGGAPGLAGTGDATRDGTFPFTASSASCNCACKLWAWVAATLPLVGLERGLYGEPGLESGNGTDFGEWGAGDNDVRDAVRECVGRRGETGGEREWDR